MNPLVAIFLTNFVFIALKATQQLNVVHDQRLLVFFTSNLMAICEVTLVARYAHSGNVIPVICAAGISGGLGCLCSMWLHKKLRNRNEKRT